MRTLFPALLGLALAGLAAVPAPAGDAATIAKLIEQLGADSFADREAASKALDKIGTPALEAVRKATKSGDAEVRKRATELAAKIGRRAASEAALAPKMVHLAFKDTPLKEAVKGFAEKSGYDIVLFDPQEKLKGKRVTLDTGKATFWAAMEKFCAAAGVVEGDVNQAGAMPNLRPRPLPAAPGGAPAIVPVPGKGKVDPNIDGEAAAAKRAAERLAFLVAAMQKEAPPPPAAVPPKPVGPKLLLNGGVAGITPTAMAPVPPGQITLVPGEEKVPADTSSSVRVRRADPKRFATNAGEKEIGLILELSAEPRLVLQQVQSLQVDVAEDDNGQKLARARPEGGSDAPPGPPVALPGGRRVIMPPFDGAGPGPAWYPPSSNGVHVYAELKLKKGEKASKSLKRLEGTVAATALGEKEALLVVESPGKAAGQSVKGKHGGQIRVTAVNKQGDSSVQVEFEFEAPPGVVAETRYRATDPRAMATRATLERAAGVAPLPFLTPGLYTPWGLTFQDDKGNALLAQIRPNFRKAGGDKVEFLATYLLDKDGKGEPARLVYTGRRQSQVQIPFKLAGVELK
jgi:hypothetical protein